MSVDAVLDVILRRRSTRCGYTDRAVPMPVLESIIKCGLAAPSSKASEPWRFTVVTDRSLLDAIATKVSGSSDAVDYRPHDPRTGLPRRHWESTVLESAEVLRQAAAAIFVQNGGPFSSGRQALLEADPESRRLAIVGYELEIAGLGAALENMWLAAVAHGLSAAFMGDVSVSEIDIRQLLDTEDDLLGVLALGYTSGEAPSKREVAIDQRLVRWL